jgi:hypothetical protein
VKPVGSLCTSPSSGSSPHRLTPRTTTAARPGSLAGDHRRDHRSQPGHWLSPNESVGRGRSGVLQVGPFPPHHTCRRPWAPTPRVWLRPGSPNGQRLGRSSTHDRKETAPSRTPSIPATATEVLSMSTTGKGKFTAFSHPAQPPVAPRPDEIDTFVHSGATREGVLETIPQPPRPATPSRVRPSWLFDRHSYADPCNYLG